MDSSGRIHQVPDGALEAALSALEKGLGLIEGDLEPIPSADVPRVRKMNRKARRRWHAKQRQK